MHLESFRHRSANYNHWQWSCWQTTEWLSMQDQVGWHKHYTWTECSAWVLLPQDCIAKMPSLRKLHKWRRTGMYGYFSYRWIVNGYCCSKVVLIGVYSKYFRIALMWLDGGKCLMLRFWICNPLDNSMLVSFAVKMHFMAVRFKRTIFAHKETVKTLRYGKR